MRGLLKATLLGLLAPGAAMAAPDLLTMSYECERGVRIPVAYVTAAEGSVAVLGVEGRQIALVLAPSASGARYAWPSDGSGYVWWSKGDEASLRWFDAEKAEEVVQYARCKVAG